MNMYQLEKLNLLYDVCFDLFDSEYDYFDFEIETVTNDFLTKSATFTIKSNQFESVVYKIEFLDDDNETIKVYRNDLIVREYERYYNDAKSYIKLKDIVYRK